MPEAIVHNDPPDISDLTDHEAAEAIQAGVLPSPSKYGQFWLFDLRITGTGMAYRDKLDEWAFRDPEKWLSDEFVQRCNGLPVIFQHPDGAGLNHEEFQNRAIGTIVLPYIKGDEVWGVAKIFDADAAELMQKTHTSTSPGVTPPKGSEPVSLEGGAKVLDEGLPLILDHLAVCEAGVWDKDGPPEGVRLDSLIGKGEIVAETTREELEKELEDAKKRADASEAELKSEREDRAKKDAAEKEERETADKAKKDAEESEAAAVAAAEKEKSDKKRAGRKDRHVKHDGDVMDCAKCDSEEEQERKDGAAQVEIEANREEEIKDSKARIDKLEAELAKFRDGQQPLTMDDSNAVASAYHRADSVYQMLGERTPLILPGEKPIAYRRRLADGLRKHTQSFKAEPIHDSAAGRAFDLVEDAIYREALEEAKNPTIKDSIGILREVITTKHGKTRTEFYGDANVAWEPFRSQVGAKITRFNKQDHLASAGRG